MGFRRSFASSSARKMRGGRATAPKRPGSWQNKPSTSMGLSEIRLEVFNHNQRAIAAYSRVGFEVTGEHVEWVPHRKTELRVIEMRLSRDAFLAGGDGDAGESARQRKMAEHKRQARQQRRKSARRRGRSERRNAQVSLERTGRDADSPETGPAAEPADPD